MLGCKGEPRPLPTTLEDGFPALCQRKVECIKVIKDTERAVKQCVTGRANNAADATPDMREALRIMVVDQAKQCLALPCEQYDACEERVFNEHLAKLPK
jgi:hypothetical protein